MRKFYIFSINDEFKNLTNSSPYNLFKTFEDIYYLDLDEQNYGINMYEQMVKPFNKIDLNNRLFTTYHKNDHYTKFMNTHIYNDYYTDEETKLNVGNAFLVLETTSAKPTFFKVLKDIKNLFICDFQNQDYFWLESVSITFENVSKNLKHKR